MKQIRKIVVLGGGVAGWMSAFLLKCSLPKSVAITLIETTKAHIGPLVEVTMPIFQELLQQLEMTELELLTSCSGTYKLATEFVSWGEPKKSWWHPFFLHHKDLDEEKLGKEWLYHKLSGHRAFSDSSTLFQVWFTPVLAGLKLSPVLKDSLSDWGFKCGYHLDAEKLAALFEKKAIQSGVEKNSAPFKEVVFLPSEKIHSIVTTKESVSGDFFIDCSGFRRSLISQMPKVRWRSFSETLLCDRMVTLSLPYLAVKEDMLPYTKVTAIDLGWVGEYSLLHKKICTLVYSSNFLSDQKAEERIRNFFSTKNIKKIEAIPSRFESGVMTPWINNCLALSAAEGYFEPLEGTAMGLLQLHLTHWIKLLKERQGFYFPETCDRYNQFVFLHYDEIHQFILSHYSGSKRRDTPFWSAVTKAPSLLQLFQKKQLPFFSPDFFGCKIFSPGSWLALAAGLESLPQVNVNSYWSIYNKKMMQYGLYSHCHEAAASVETLTAKRSFYRQLANAFKTQYAHLHQSPLE